MSDAPGIIPGMAAPRIGGGAVASAPREWQTEPRTLGHRAATMWLNMLFWSASHVPWLAKATLPMWGWGAWTFSPALRRRTMANAARLLGGASSMRQRRRLGRAVIRSFYLFVYDVARHAAMTPDQIAQDIGELRGKEHYDALRGQQSGKRGVIIATAHMGSFEIGIAALRQHEPVVHVVFQRDRLGLFERLRSRLRETLDVRQAAVEDGVAGWMELREALSRDEAVLMQADRAMPGQKSVGVPFMGEVMQLPLGVVKLAALTGAPILPVFTNRRDDGRVDVTIESAIEPDSPGVFYRAGVTPPTLLKLAAMIEKHVAAHPEQWLMIRPAWQKDAGAA